MFVIFIEIVKKRNVTRQKTTVESNLNTVFDTTRLNKVEDFFDFIICLFRHAVLVYSL